MDNIGDWLYIVLMALAVVSSLISAARKKKQEAEKRDIPYPDPDKETVDDEPAGKDAWEVMREMQRQEEARQREIRRQHEAQAARSASRQIKTISSPFLSGERVSSQLSHSATSSLLTETDTSPILDEGAFTDPEELRKAVIYTEILNRKY